MSLGYTLLQLIFYIFRTALGGKDIANARVKFVVHIVSARHTRKEDIKKERPCGLSFISAQMLPLSALAPELFNQIIKGIVRVGSRTENLHKFADATLSYILAII